MHAEPETQGEFFGSALLPFVILGIDETRTEAESQFKIPVTEAKGEVIDIVGSKD
jgi:hypothetical protein